MRNYEHRENIILSILLLHTEFIQVIVRPGNYRKASFEIFNSCRLEISICLT